MDAPAQRGYRARDAAASPLYRSVLDHLESYLAERARARDDPAHPCAESSLRHFLQCGIARFGVARFLCGKCGESRFVPFSCKRRMACVSCDAKRALIESGHAMAELLPCVAYRQWVLVLPKRLRYFVHRDARLPGEISRILAETLTDFYRRRCAAAPKDAAPAQFHVLQRFGSSVNLHLHDHAVVSDGAFSLENGLLRFHHAPPPSASELTELVEGLRHGILRRMLRLRAVPEATITDLLAWSHSGFSLDAGTLVSGTDRAGLERLLLYVLRPALSLKQLTYKPEARLVRYRPAKGRPDSPAVLEWSGVEFVRRLAALIPPPRKHMVRYYGALGPRSALRRAVGAATRDRATGAELEAGYGVSLLGAVARTTRRALAASARSWAACIRKIFEVDPVRCVKCGGEMKLAAIVLDDGELSRILAYQGWPSSWPKTKPPRAPPAQPPGADEDSQVDPRGDRCNERQDFPAEDFPG